MNTYSRIRYPKDTILDSSTDRVILRRDNSSLKLRLGNTIQIHPEVRRLVIRDNYDGNFNIRTFLEYKGQVFPIYTKSILIRSPEAVVLSITSGISEFLNKCGYANIGNFRDHVRDALIADLLINGDELPYVPDPKYADIDNVGSSLHEFMDDKLLRDEILNKNIELYNELEDLDVEYNLAMDLPESCRLITEDTLNDLSPEDLFTSTIYRYIADVVDKGDVSTINALESLSNPILPDGYNIDELTGFSSNNPVLNCSDFNKMYGAKGVLYDVPNDGLHLVTTFSPELLVSLRRLHELPFFELVFEYILSTGGIIIHHGTCANYSFKPVEVLRYMKYDLDTIVQEITEDVPQRAFFKFSNSEEMLLVTVSGNKIRKYYIDLILATTLSLGLSRRIQ